MCDKDGCERCGQGIVKFLQSCCERVVHIGTEIAKDVREFDLNYSMNWMKENIEWAGGPCIYQLFMAVTPNKINPEMYLAAWVETFIIMLAMSWIATGIWNQDVIATNRIKDVMGYNNVCVGFDEVPARYIALPGMVAMSYLGIRYVMLDSWRDKLQAQHKDISKCSYYFSYTANCLFAITMLFWPMLLLVTPGGDEDWHLKYHFYIYVLFVVLAMVNIAANFSQAPKVTIYSQVWIFLFGLDTFLLLTVGAAAFNLYDYDKCPNSLAATPNRTLAINKLCEQDPSVSVGFLGFVDYMWFIFLGMTPIFLPDAPCIVLKDVTLGDEIKRNLTATDCKGSNGVVNQTVILRDASNPHPPMGNVLEDASGSMAVPVQNSGGGDFSETKGPMQQ